MKKKKYKYDDIFTIYLFIILWIYVIYINNKRMKLQLRMIHGCVPSSQRQNFYSIRVRT